VAAATTGGYIAGMGKHTVAEAAEHLPDLFERALRGETVIITGEGQAAVELRAVPTLPAPGKPWPIQEQLAWLRARRPKLPPGDLDAVALINQLRDEDEDRVSRPERS